MNSRVIGTIYASTNKSCPGMLKIGKTLNTAQSRARQTVTGSPWPMVPVSWFEFSVADDAELKKIEKAVHNRPEIRPYRQNHGGGTEWFAVDVETFKKAVQHVQANHPATRVWLEQKAIGLAAWKAKQERERAEREAREAEQNRIRAEQNRIRAEQNRIRAEREAAERAEQARIRAENDAKTKALSIKTLAIVCASVLVWAGFDYSVLKPRRDREAAIVKIEQERIRAEAQRVEAEQERIRAEREVALEIQKRNKRLADAVMLEEQCVPKIKQHATTINIDTVKEAHTATGEDWVKRYYTLTNHNRPGYKKTAECFISPAGRVNVKVDTMFTYAP